jgi:hypothetical protein
LGVRAECIYGNKIAKTLRETGLKHKENDFLLKAINFLPRAIKNTIANALPYPENYLPQVEKDIPYAEIHLPQVKNDIPWAENCLPFVENYLPQTTIWLPLKYSSTFKYTGYISLILLYTSL